MSGIKYVLKRYLLGFPGGAVVESPPADAGDTGSCPGLGGSHMLRSGWARQHGCWACASGPCAPQRERPRQWGVRVRQKRKKKKKKSVGPICAGLFLDRPVLLSCVSITEEFLNNFMGCFHELLPLLRSFWCFPFYTSDCGFVPPVLLHRLHARAARPAVGKQREGAGPPPGT